MSTFKKGAIATITAAALAAGLCTPASAADSKFKTEFKDDKCTVFVDGEAYETFESTAEANEILGDILKTIDNTTNSIENVKRELAEADGDGELRKNALNEALKAYQNTLAFFIKYRAAAKACTESRSVSETDVEAQALLSTADGKGLSPAGIGVTVAGVVVVVLGAIVAALPMLKPMLPAPIANMLP
ncbi:hypothetical protein QZG57_08165 [Corynebacterium glucuronolyticum]|uniref:hypothetical protein n=1 Tax=Corynebacterium glucuronolyticum TaxID=39791 RepID=UPI003F6DB34D